MKGRKGVKRRTTLEKVQQSKQFVIITQGNLHPAIYVRR
jgi:hypothetical protein